MSPHASQASIDEGLSDFERKVFTQPLALAMLGRYIIKLFRVRVRCDGVLPPSCCYFSSVATHVYLLAASKPCPPPPLPSQDAKSLRKKSDWYQNDMLRKFPIVLAVSHPHTSIGMRWCTVLGLPITGSIQESALTKFLKSFQEAAKAVGAQYLMDSFDSATLLIDADHRNRFFEALDLPD